MPKMLSTKSLQVFLHRKNYLMQLKIGTRELELGSRYLKTLRDSNDLLGDAQALQERMAEDGYLLLRGLQDQEKVRATRDFLFGKLDENEQIDHEFPIEQGMIKEGAHGSFLGGSKSLTRDPVFLNLVESPEIVRVTTCLKRNQSIISEDKLSLLSHRTIIILRMNLPDSHFGTSPPVAWVTLSAAARTARPILAASDRFMRKAGPDTDTPATGSPYALKMGEAMQRIPSARS